MKEGWIIVGPLMFLIGWLVPFGLTVQYGMWWSSAASFSGGLVMLAAVILLYRRYG